MREPDRVLIIGFGNRLLGDDAVGPLVAERVAAWKRDGVEAIAVHQLTPELAAQIAEVGRVLFVDASAVAPVVTLHPVLPARVSAAPGHVLHPDALLGWAGTLCPRVPPAWLLTVPARRFEAGVGLSVETHAGMDEGLTWIQRWLDGATVLPQAADSSS